MVMLFLERGSFSVRLRFFREGFKFFWRGGDAFGSVWDFFGRGWDYFRGVLSCSGDLKDFWVGEIFSG